MTDNSLTGIAQPSVERRHIESTPGRCGGRPCVAGHRIRVQDIVLWTEQNMSPDDIVASLPQITLADVHAALAYYHDNVDQINRDIREDDEYVAAMKIKDGPGPLSSMD